MTPDYVSVTMWCITVCVWQCDIWPYVCATMLCVTVCLCDVWCVTVCMCNNTMCYCMFVLRVTSPCVTVPCVTIMFHCAMVSFLSHITQHNSVYSHCRINITPLSVISDNRHLQRLQSLRAEIPRWTVSEARITSKLGRWIYWLHVTPKLLSACYLNINPCHQSFLSFFQAAVVQRKKGQEWQF